MEYRVEINPAKEKEFLQLLKAWQSLGVVEAYRILLTQDVEEESSSSLFPRARKRSTPETAWDMAEPYKDLLD